MERAGRQKLFILAGIGLALLVLVLTVLALFRPKLVEIEIYVVPSDAAVTIDGKSTKGGFIKVAPGKHKFTATRQHFTPATDDIDTNTMETPRAVYLALFPSDSDGENYLLTHPEEEDRYERISGNDFSVQQKKLYAENSAILKLPHSTIDYKIGYRVDENQDVVYTVQLYPYAAAPGTDLYNQQLTQLKASALDWLKSIGVDPASQKVEVTPDQ